MFVKRGNFLKKCLKNLHFPSLFKIERVENVVKTDKNHEFLGGRER